MKTAPALLALVLALVLAACAPAAEPRPLDGLWQGCTIAYDLDVDCPWGASMEPGDPRADGTPPVVIGPDPMPPIVIDEPDPEDPAAPPADETCKPGHGHGDPNHCHDGPPGRSR